MSDIEKVKQLREATGAGFKDCNLVIKESGGDLDKAVEIFREENIPLGVEQTKLVTKAQGITGAMTVDFDGKERKLSLRLLI